MVPNNNPDYLLSTIFPTRRSIIDGTGSPASSATAGEIFFPPDFLPPSGAPFSLGCFFSFVFLSSFGTASLVIFAALTVSFVISSFFFEDVFSGGEVSEDVVFFSFFFGGSTFRSNLGMLSRSKVTREYAGDRLSAALRTEGLFWI